MRRRRASERFGMAAWPFAAAGVLLTRRDPLMAVGCAASALVLVAVSERLR